jgi:hypothetical protein
LFRDLAIPRSADPDPWPQVGRFFQAPLQANGEPVMQFNRQ